MILGRTMNLWILNAKARFKIYKKRIQEVFKREMRIREFQVKDNVMRHADALKDIGKLEAN